MPAPIAYLNGQYVPFAEARLPVWDLSIVQGATVTDMVRTFGGMPFRLEQHLERFAASRRVLGIDLPESDEEIGEIVREIIRRTHPHLRPGSDCGVVMFATPGAYAGYSRFGGKATDSSVSGPTAPAARIDDEVATLDDLRPARATLCVHPFPLPFAKFHYWYGNGMAVAVPQVRQVPAFSIPPTIKYRSRLHWYLAEREARETDPGASALLLDEHGCLTETNTGNLFIVREGQLLTPRAETTLPGISQAYVSELARAEGIKVVRADLTPDYVLNADEAFLTSTTYCIAPLTWLDGAPIHEARPGPLFRALLARWSEAVGVDILAQAEQLGGG